MIAELRAIPDLMVRNWLKMKGLPRSGDVIERIESLLQTSKLTAEVVEGFIDEMKDNGRKHIFLFYMPEVAWTEAVSATNLLAKFEALRTQNKTGNDHVFGMKTEKAQVAGNMLMLRLGKTISVPRVDKDKRITHENREWAAIVYEKVHVSIIFKVNFDLKTIEMKFDAVTDMGAEKKRIYTEGVNFLNQALGLTQVNSLGLSSLAPKIESSDVATVFDLIAKVETENADGTTVTGTVRVARDDGGIGSASELPGGKVLLTDGNGDILIDTYHIIWLEHKSNGKLTRNIRTQIHSLTGELHFRHHAFEEETEYVLSTIRSLIS